MVSDQSVFKCNTQVLILVLVRMHGLAHGSGPLMSPARSGWPKGGNWESLDRAEDRMGGETSQLAPARCVMRGVLGRERSKGRTVEKWRVKTKYGSTYRVHCYG